ncbi:MAG TPA: crotonase/enoyl-CoA hydratase family protein [Thermoanaerobaculia bacterium]|nr:crotonase/enoyl-CoA hydratase family protein [Thermoanaerobaculia bacterium]
MAGTRTERAGPVTTVLLDRREVRNAVDPATAAELAQAFRAFEADDEARAAVFCGDHGTFCAGADLEAVARRERELPPDAPYEGDGPMGPTRLVLSKPVVAAIAGHAVAGGLELALWCDLRVVEEDAVLGVFNRRFGVPLIDGGTVRLARLIGLSHALDLILTGRPVNAEEALVMGLANRIVGKGEARAEAERIALELSRFPQRGLLADRASAYRSFDLPFDAAMSAEFRAGIDALEEGVEGARRFVAGEGRGGRFA